MTRITPWALCGLALLAATACRRPSEGPPLDSTLRSLVPGDTVALAGLNLDSLRSTALYQRYANRPLPPLDRWSASTGLDPRRDLTLLLLAWNGSETLIIARARFDPARLQSALSQAGASRQSYRGLPLYPLRDSAILQFDSSTLLAGPLRLVRAAVDRPRSSPLPSALGPLVAQLPPSAQLWAVSQGQIALPLPERSNLQNLNKVLAGVTTLSASADLFAGLRLRALAATAGESAAQSLHGGLRGLLGMARLSTPSTRPELLQLLDSVLVTQTGSAVRLNADLSQAQLDTLFELAASLTGLPITGPPSPGPKPPRPAR